MDRLDFIVIGILIVSVAVAAYIIDTEKSLVPAVATSNTATDTATDTDTDTATGTDTATVERSPYNFTVVLKTGEEILTNYFTFELGSDVTNVDGDTYSWSVIDRVENNWETIDDETD